MVDAPETPAKPCPAVDGFVTGWCHLGALLQQYHQAAGQEPARAQQLALETLVDHAVRRFSQAGEGPPGTPHHAAVDAFLDRFRYSGQTDAAAADSITPAHLSHACEALLASGQPGALQHRAGIHYTSAAEVELVCRLTLATYLAGVFAADPAIARLLHQLALEREANPATDEALVACNLWPALLDRFDTLTVLDPTCGTGGFLAGMSELLEGLTRRGQIALGRMEDPGTRAERRRRLYGRLLGVDLMPWALAVARLRLLACLGLAGPQPEDTLVAGDAAVLVWEQVFPQYFAGPEDERGVDLLLGNPPYVRHETLGASAVKHALRTRLARSRPAWFARWPLDGRSDLSLYLTLLGFALLRPGGTLGLVTSSAWLDAGYGEPLRAFLREAAHAAWIIDSAAERTFAAAVNTILWVASASHEASEPTRFVTLRLPLGRIMEDPAATFVALLHAAPLVQTPAYRALSVRWSDAQRAPAVSRRAARWGGPYLRAPTLWQRFDDCAHPLIALGRTPVLKLGRGRRTGADAFFYLTAEQAAREGIEARFLRPLVKSPSEFFDIAPRTSALVPSHRLFFCDVPPEALAGTGAGRHVNHPDTAAHQPRRAPGAGERPWYQLVSQPCGQLLLPIAVHERFLVIDNDAGYEAHQRFAVLVFAPRYRPALVPVVAACLASIVVVLQLEALGRRALGHGALDIPPEDWRAVLLPEPTTLAPATRHALARAWEALSAQPPQTLSQAATCPRQRALDALVLDILGWPPAVGDALYEEALALLQTRLRKARR